jgi:hypothetical protein
MMLSAIRMFWINHHLSQLGDGRTPPPCGARKESVMRTEQEILVGDATAGLVSAHPLGASIQKNRWSASGNRLCVYGCGRKAVKGHDCCRTCKREASTPLPFDSPLLDPYLDLDPPEELAELDL